MPKKVPPKGKTRKGVVRAKTKRKSRTSVRRLPKRKNSTKKTLRRNRPTRKRKLNARPKVRIATDTRYWRNRKRRSKTVKRASYSKKSLRTRKTKKIINIKKKSKQVVASPPNKKLFRKLVSESARYLKLKRKKTGESNKKSVYIKLFLQDRKTGQYRWTSVKRQNVYYRDDMAAIFRALFVAAPGYGEEIEVIGYEVEEIIE